MTERTIPSETPPPPLALNKSMQKGSRSPWLIVVVGGLVGLAFVLVLGFLLNLLGEEESLPHFEYQATMPDGTILVIEAVSWGKSHHVELTGMPRRNMFSGYVNNEIDHTTVEDRLVVFMRRFDPVTRRPLDFTWWGRSRARDALGSELFDSSPYQESIWRYGSSSGGGSRPLPAPDNMYYMDRGDSSFAIVAYSEFPAVRVDGETFHLTVENVDGEVVAEFDLPYDGPRISEVWTADALPNTQADGAVSLTLNEISAAIDDSYWVNDIPQYRYYLNYSTQFEYQGMPTSDWYVNRVWYTDPLGNTSDGYNINMSWGEPAWKMHMTAQPYDWNTVPLQPGESAVIGTFTLPVSAGIEFVSTSMTLGGITVDWASFGAPYTTHTVGRGSGYGSGSSGFYFEDQHITLSYEDNYSSPRTLRVDGNVYSLVGINRSSFTSGYYQSSVKVRITTPEGEEIPAETNMNLSDFVTVVFVPPDDVTEVTATLEVREFPEFEFLVAPPEQPPLPSASETAAHE